MSAKPLLIKAGDQRVILGGHAPKVDCRVVSEALYQKMSRAYQNKIVQKTPALELPLSDLNLVRLGFKKPKKGAWWELVLPEYHNSGFRSKFSYAQGFLFINQTITQGLTFAGACRIYNDLCKSKSKSKKAEKFNPVMRDNSVMLEVRVQTVSQIQQVYRVFTGKILRYDENKLPQPWKKA